MRIRPYKPTNDTPTSVIETDAGDRTKESFNHICIGATPTIIPKAATNNANAALSRNVYSNELANSAKFTTLYCPYNNATANKTHNVLNEPTTKNVNPVITDSARSVQNETNPVIATMVITRNTKKLNISPVKITPIIPTSNNNINI